MVSNMKGNLWCPQRPLKRDTVFELTDSKSFPHFRPSYEVNKEKHDMWAVMSNDYQKRWESERDVVRSDYEYYRKEKDKQLSRRYVPKNKMAAIRKEHEGAKKETGIIFSKFHGVPSCVKSNLESPNQVNKSKIEVSAQSNEKKRKKKKRVEGLPKKQ